MHITNVRHRGFQCQTSLANVDPNSRRSQERLDAREAPSVVTSRAGPSGSARFPLIPNPEALRQARGRLRAPPRGLGTRELTARTAREAPQSRRDPVQGPPRRLPPSEAGSGSFLASATDARETVSEGGTGDGQRTGEAGTGNWQDARRVDRQVRHPAEPPVRRDVGRASDHRSQRPRTPTG